MNDTHDEALVKKLHDPTFLESYKKPYDDIKIGLLPRLLGSCIVFCGNTVYGSDPSYRKFRAIEMIARIPYQSWEVATYTLLSMFYTNEKRALKLSQTLPFARVAQDNETMHVVVLSQLAKKHHNDSHILNNIIPILFSLVYFWMSFFLYIFSFKSSMQLNYVFENHAFEQYDAFAKKHEDILKKTSVKSDFLDFYGREVQNEFELICSIRNDEIIHRNHSIDAIKERG